MTIANAINLNSATLVVEDAVQTLSGAMALSGTNTVNVVYGDKPATFSGVISGTGGLTKSTGTGGLTLGGNNTYTGATIVNAGRLTLTGTNASTITVNNGATLASRGSTSGGLTTNTGSNIALNGVTPATGFVAAGAVNFAGSTNVGFDAVPTTLGTTQHLVAGYGTLSGLANLVAPSGYRSTFVNDTVNSQVLLEVTAGTRTWNRTTAGNWDILSSSSWAEGDNQFANSDAVLFDDTATDGSVNLVGSLNPSAVTFNNSSTTYSLTGTGVIAGLTGINKSGSGTASIATANTYTGATTVTDGVLVIGNNSALGSTAGGTTVSGTGQLRMDGGISVGAEALSLAGSGSGGAGALFSSAGTNTYGGRITTSGATTVAVATGSTLNLTGGFTLNNTLTKTGGGTLALTAYSGSSAAAASDFVVDEGVLQFGSGYFNSSPFGYRALTITVNTNGILRTTTAHALGGDNIDGGTSFGQIRLIGGEYNLLGSQYISAGTVSGEGRLLLQGGSVTGSSDFRANGGASGAFITSLASATTSVIGNSGGLSLQYGSLTIDAADGTATTDLRVTGPITSPAANTNTLTKTGAGALELTGTNTYTGATNVNAGTLLINGNSSAATGAVTVASAATLGGTGTVGGAVTVNGSIAPGSNDIGTLNAGNNVTWNSGSSWKFELSSSDNTSDVLAITGQFVKGTGGAGTFVFDFMGSTPVWGETYTLATFGSLAGGFTAGDVTPFSHTNLGAGSYSTSYFTLTGTSLTFTAVPEPGTALAGLLLTAGLLRRRRKDEI
jgi:autotransporter-associated beta strand protein